MIKVGVTELHGIADEVVKNPPEGVSYTLIDPIPSFADVIIRSPAKGVLNKFTGEGVDLIEAPLFPVLTAAPWIYTPADAHSAMAFNFLGLPTPRVLRAVLLKLLFERDNFHALIFKSNAGLKTLAEYPLLNTDRIKKKCHVVYPAVRRVEVERKVEVDRLRIVFVGDFFRKGGVHVVDAFLELRLEFPYVDLEIYCDPKLEFPDENMRKKYLDLIRKNGIKLEFVSREKLFKEIYPAASIFVCPTYQETFGFAILEAMAFGLPVVASNVFAIPEIVEDGSSGLLLDFSSDDFIQSIKGYRFDFIPEKFRADVSELTYYALRKLIGDEDMRRSMGDKGLNLARKKFSIEARNTKLCQIYAEVIA